MRLLCSSCFFSFDFGRVVTCPAEIEQCVRVIIALSSAPAVYVVTVAFWRRRRASLANTLGSESDGCLRPGPSCIGQADFSLTSGVGRVRNELDAVHHFPFAITVDGAIGLPFSFSRQTLRLRGGVVCCGLDHIGWEGSDTDTWSGIGRARRLVGARDWLVRHQCQRCRLGASEASTCLSS